jgi:putative ABC transport system substrate-binding protein
MTRRDFITLLGCAAAWPLTARAQQPQRMRRIGVLMGYPEGDADAQSLIAAFQEEFQKLGWRPDQNIHFEYRWAMSNVELMQRYAKELVALAPDLILSSGTPTTAALVQQTSTIPIVFAVVVDPVGSGFVSSMKRDHVTLGRSAESRPEPNLRAKLGIVALRLGLLPLSIHRAFVL